eukprot:GHVR01007237.1.p1 GENE.GHVR01007237.1~~GHVR01007237.1.p1  ORF type:complete len:241 (+),score=23.12 GHVR01007237.1:141-863(+)
MQSDFAILGISENASVEDARKAWHALARKHHPDTVGASSSATDRMAKINAAWDRIQNGKPKVHQAPPAPEWKSNGRSFGASLTEQARTILETHLMSHAKAYYEEKTLPEMDDLPGYHILNRIEVIDGEIRLIFPYVASAGKNIICFPFLTLPDGNPQKTQVLFESLNVMTVHAPSTTSTRIKLGNLKKDGYPSIPIYLYFNTTSDRKKQDKQHLHDQFARHKSRGIKGAFARLMKKVSGN